MNTSHITQDARSSDIATAANERVLATKMPASMRDAIHDTLAYGETITHLWNTCGVGASALVFTDSRMFSVKKGVALIRYQVNVLHISCVRDANFHRAPEVFGYQIGKSGVAFGPSALNGSVASGMQGGENALKEPWVLTFKNGVLNEISRATASLAAA